MLVHTTQSLIKLWSTYIGKKYWKYIIFQYYNIKCTPNLIFVYYNLIIYKYSKAGRVLT